MADTKTQYDERELKHIYHAIHYSGKLHHGISGHSEYMLIGKMAVDLGMCISGNSLYQNEVLLLTLNPMG